MLSAGVAPTTEPDSVARLEARLCRSTPLSDSAPGMPADEAPRNSATAEESGVGDGVAAADEAVEAADQDGQHVGVVEQGVQCGRDLRIIESVPNRIGGGDR